MKITELFEQGKFVVTAELGPPKGSSLKDFLSTADKHLRDIDAINVTDSQSSNMHINSFAACKALSDEGHNTIFQLVCRDRNRIALQSDLLGAAALGIENLLLITGDHISLGDHPHAMPVFDLDSVSLIHTVKLLEQGIDLGGKSLDGEPPKFAKGAVVSPCADTVDLQLSKMEKKIAAGAEFFQTQAVFESDKFINFIEKAKQFNVPIILGLIIPKSARQLRFMSENIAGISVPADLIDEFEADPVKAKSGITGIESTVRMINLCKEYCQGVHIMAFGWESKIPDVLKKAEISQ
jgi:5,10-methylenetetrahydrofolate reductase